MPAPKDKNSKEYGDYISKISAASKKQDHSWKIGIKASKETRNKQSEARKGKKFSHEHRKNMSGKNHWNWKGGINPINDSIRKSIEYRIWREAVFIRDGYACIWGGKEHGNNINADHIKPFAIYPELRFAIDNGRTLCVKCHMKTDTYAGRVNKLTKN